MQTILGPIVLKHLQLAFEKLGWSPPDSGVIIASLRGDPQCRTKALDLDPAVRAKWVERLWDAEKLDRKERDTAYSIVRADIGAWLDHYTRGDDRPK